MMTDQAAIDAGVAAIQGLRDLMWDRVQHGVMRDPDDEDWVERVIAAAEPHLRQAWAEDDEAIQRVVAWLDVFVDETGAHLLSGRNVEDDAMSALRAALDVQEPEA